MNLYNFFFLKMSHRFIIEIPQDQYSIINQIGSGTFSDIFSATHIKTNTNVALKISLKTNSKEYDKMLEEEVEINKTLHHPFICKFFTEFETEHLSVIVMELVDGVTALDYVNQSHGLPISEVANFFTQLLIAIEYLHDEVHIAHRDLKLENIMIDNSGHIRLIDFGFSTNKSVMSTICGSIPYCAPEVLSGQMYTKESDIWSMGVILYALYDGNLPFFHQNTNTLAALICNNDVKFKNGFDELLKDLLTKILTKDPQQRIKIDDIKLHPFLANERLLQIDYKQLFSPTYNQIHSSRTVQNIKLTKPSSIKLGSPDSNHTTSQIKKSGFFRLQSSSINFPAQMQEILHEKITLKTDDIDQAIENRKDFAHNLTKLIEYEFLNNLQGIPTANTMSCENLTLTGSSFSFTSSQISLQNTHLTLDHPGTSDHLSDLNHSRHFVLTNRFAGIKNHTAGHSLDQAHEKNHSRSASPQNENLKNTRDLDQLAAVPRYKKTPSNEHQIIHVQNLQHPTGSQQPNSTYQSHAINSLGLQQQYLILKSHRRHSTIRGLSPQALIISPNVARSRSNFSDELE